MAAYPKRLIEVDLPIKRISAHSRREKSIRHGHISTLHIWWARRPLAACRAVICAALWPDPVDALCPELFRKAARAAMLEWTSHERQILLSEESRPRFEAARKKPAHFDEPMELRGALLDFIADFSNWDNSTVKQYLATSRALTQAAHEALGGHAGTRPLVADPFAGGGSIPLEVFRVGADAFASDLNPIPVLLNKVVLEYIPKHGFRLAEEVRKWGEWLKNEAEKELGDYYPVDADGAVPVTYLWARTVRCEGPGCGAEVPLFRSACIANRGKKSVWFKSKRSLTVPNKIDIELAVGDASIASGPEVLRRSAATCPLCGFTTSAEKVRAQFLGRAGGAADARLMAVVTCRNGVTGRNYRLPVSSDELALEKARAEFQRLTLEAPDEILSEPLPYLRSIFNIHLLDVTKWGQLFSPRQLVSLLTLVRLVKKLRDEIGDSSLSLELKEAVVVCLALSVDRVAAQFSSLSWWQPKGEFVVGTFGRQALGIIWDFAEIRPVHGASGDLDGAIDWVARVLEANDCGYVGNGHAELASATKHPLPDDSVVAVVTDPPYYDAVPYADLSDFFYVLLKRMIGGAFNGLFPEDLSTKRGEIVQLAERNATYSYKTKEYFEDGMRNALAEARRITVPEGIAVVVFAHKTTQGWEVMLSSIIDAGWVVTASWPIDTERAVRMRATGSAALGSSIHLVCRPREHPDGSVRVDDVGDWRDVLAELPFRIHDWMPRLADEGVVGADAIFACLGPALEVFSRYSRVEKASGETVALKEYLEYVWAAVAKEALAQVFKDADTAAFEPDARLTAMWLWTLNAGAISGAEGADGDEEPDDDDDVKGKAGKAKKGGFVLEYDAARKISQGLGANLDDLKHVVEVSGETARLLPVAERTQYLFGKDQAQVPSGGRKKKQDTQMDFFGELAKVGADETAWGEKTVKRVGETTLDRVHQGMILFATGRGEALKRFLVDDGAGNDQRFWRLAQALSALYPVSANEKRWVDGVLARKKGLGL